MEKCHRRWENQLNAAYEEAKDRFGRTPRWNEVYLPEPDNPSMPLELRQSATLNVALDDVTAQQ